LFLLPVGKGITSNLADSLVRLGQRSSSEVPQGAELLACLFEAPVVWEAGFTHVVDYIYCVYSTRFTQVDGNWHGIAWCTGSNGNIGIYWKKKVKVIIFSKLLVSLDFF